MPSVPPALKDPLRQIAARPAAAAASAVLLALGIALVTAMFSTVDALVLRPAPFPHADRLVQVGVGAPDRGVIDAWRASGLVDAVEVSREAAFHADDSGTTMSGAFVTAGLFELLGARPIRGRMFTQGSAERASDEIVLSETVWRAQFGGDPDLVGRRIRIDGEPLLVTGIMAQDFRFPTPATGAWRPLAIGSSRPGVWRVIARLRPGIPRADADVRLLSITRDVAAAREAYVSPVRGVGPAALPDATQRALLLLLAGVGFVFIVLCANASSLFLTQLARRQRDLAVRAALGASKATLVRNAVIEQGCLAAAAVALGALMATAVLRLVPPDLLGGSLNPIDLDRRAFAVASALGIAGLMLAGLVPGLLAGHASIVEGIRLTAASTTPARGARRASQGFVVVQVAFACGLLIGSGLLIKSFANLTRADRGLDVDGILRVTVSLPSRSFDNPARLLTNDAIHAAFRALPSVSAVALSQEIPPGPTQTGGGQVRAQPGDPFVASDGYRIGPGFFSVYGIPLIRGREFDAGGDEVIVSERLAERLWPGADPLGKRFSIGVLPGTRRVIGVAREIAVPALDATLERPEFYQPYERDARVSYVSVRCAAACPDEMTIRERVARINPAITVRGVSGSEAAYLRHLAVPKLLAELASIFGVCALATAAAGVFSVVMHAVGSRRRELGIRKALGASSFDLLKTVAGGVMAVAAGGVAAGAAGGWMIGRALRAFQYGVEPGDPAVWAGVVGATALACVLAAWVPVRRAIRTDPANVLKDA